MPSFTVPPRPLRRLVAALLTLSVLLTSLGWAHPACEPMVGASDAAAVVAGDHAGMSGMPAAGQAAGEDAGHPADHCSGHGRHPAPDEGACAMVAHCSAATVSTATAISVPELRALTQPAVPSAGRLLERAYQPESPPPRA